MDLTKLAVDTDGTALELRHPVTGEVLYDDDGKAITITLLGMDSEPFKRAQRAIINKRLQQGQKAKVTAEDLEKEAVDTLVGCTVDWSGIVLDGKPVPFSKDAARALYTRSDLPFIREQVDSFIAERSNFMKASAKD